MAVYRAEKLGGQAGQWVAVWQDAQRKQRQQTFPTQGAAKDHLAEVRKASKQYAPGSADAEITVAQFSEKWLKAVAASAKPRTVENYTANLKTHLLPAFGEVKVRLVHRAGIKSWALSLLDQKKAPSTVGLLVSVFGTLLSAAVDESIITANPCAGLTRALKLGKRSKDSATADEIKAFTAIECDQVLGAIEKNHPNTFPLFLFLARTGVRIGEALGCKWEDLDLGSGKVRISRTLSRGRVGSPKGGRARTVSLSPQLVESLKRLEVSRLAWALEHGKESAPEWVFTTSKGHPFAPSDVRRVLSRALVVAGVARHHSPHSFRHTFASLLLSRGESLQFVKEQLGHSSIRLTADVYGRWLPAVPVGGGVASLDPVAVAVAA